MGGGEGGVDELWQDVKLVLQPAGITGREALIIITGRPN